MSLHKLGSDRGQRSLVQYDFSGASMGGVSGLTLFQRTKLQQGGPTMPPTIATVKLPIAGGSNQQRLQQDGQRGSKPVTLVSDLGKLGGGKRGSVDKYATAVKQKIPFDRRTKVVAAGFQRAVNVRSKDFNSAVSKNKSRIRNQERGLVNIDKGLQDIEFKSSSKVVFRPNRDKGSKTQMERPAERTFTHRRASIDIINESSSSLHLPPLSTNTTRTPMKIPKSDLALAERLRMRRASAGVVEQIDEVQEYYPVVASPQTITLQPIECPGPSSSDVMYKELYSRRLRHALRQDRSAKSFSQRRHNDDESDLSRDAEPMAQVAIAAQGGPHLTRDPSMDQGLPKASSVVSLASLGLRSFDHRSVSKLTDDQFLQKYKKNPNIAAIDLLKIDKIENKLQHIHNKYQRMQVKHDYRDWAMQSLHSGGTSQGVASTQETLDPQAQHTALVALPEMTSGADVIFKFKHIFIKRRNEAAAVRLQTLLRGRMQRLKYLRLRHRVLAAAVFIQSFIRMRQIRVRYLRHQYLERERAAFVCQKFLRGYLAFRYINSRALERVGVAMDHLSNQMDRLTLKHKTDLQIKLRFAWRLHKRRKEIAKEKKLAKQKKAKKKGAKATKAVGANMITKLAQKMNVPETQLVPNLETGAGQGTEDQKDPTANAPDAHKGANENKAEAPKQET